MGKLMGRAGMSAPAPKRDRTRATGDLPQLRALLSSEISPLSASCSECRRRSKFVALNRAQCRSTHPCSLGGSVVLQSCVQASLRSGMRSFCFPTMPCPLSRAAADCGAWALKRACSTSPWSLMSWLSACLHGASLAAWARPLQSGCCWQSLSCAAGAEGCRWGLGAAALPTSDHSA